MIQCRGSAGFPLEALKGRGVLRKLRRQAFQRHTTAELEVFRLVDHAHPAAPDLPQNPEISYRLPDQSGSSNPHEELTIMLRES
jgi:hypothetical protein